MIKIRYTEVYGWEAAIRGMRNPLNSWDKSDSMVDCPDCGSCPYFDGTFETPMCCMMKCFVVGENDLKLMQKLSKAGSDHAKFLRMITVTCDITAPIYFWKQVDQYRVGVVTNSTSTMHKIHTKPFEVSDFSTDHMTPQSLEQFQHWVDYLECVRLRYIDSKDKAQWYDRNKAHWYDLIQLLPSSYNQIRTVQLNYAVLKNMYHARKNHKLDEWHDFCAWCESLPYFKEICIGDE